MAAAEEQTIVAGTDGPATAERAVREAASLARSTGARLVLVSAVSDLQRQEARRNQPETGRAARGRAPSARKPAADESLDRLRTSLDAAEVALKDLRSGVGKGSRDLVRDLEKALGHLNTNARRVSRAVAKDLAAVGSDDKAGKAAPKRPAARKSSSRKAGSRHSR